MLPRKTFSHNLQARYVTLKFPHVPLTTPNVSSSHFGASSTVAALFRHDFNSGKFPLIFASFLQSSKWQLLSASILQEKRVRKRGEAGKCYENDAAAAEMKGDDCAAASLLPPRLPHTLPH